MALDKVDQISLPGGESGPLEEGEGLSGTSSLGQGRLKGVTLSPIIVHSLKTDEPEFYFFLVEWGPDDGNPDNILREAIPGSKVVGKQQYVSHPYKIIDCIRGEWYRFRVSTVNKYGWRSGTLPIPPAGPEADDEANYWVYQRAGFDEDDLVRLDEATNILPNSDFEFDTLENGSLELPYWQYKVNGTWADCFHGVGPIERGIFGRLTAPHLILKPGGYIRSAIVDMYKDRPYALSGFFVQDVLGRGNLTFRIAYYDASDNFLDHDYVLMGEDGIRVINSTTWVGGSVFETRDRCGTVFFPPDNVAYGRVEIINNGTSDIWADDLMLSQSNKVTRYVSWDRQSIEAYRDTWQYRRDIPPNGVISFDGLVPIQHYSNEDGSIDLKLRWDYTEGTRYTSGFMMFCNIADSGVYSPTPSIDDYDFAYKLANSGAKKFDLLGINPVNRYSFAIAPYATTRGGVSYGSTTHYQDGPNFPHLPDTLDWVDYQGSTAVNLGAAPRTQVNIIYEDDNYLILEFEVTSSLEAATTYYRLVASGAFSPVVDAGGTQLTVQRSTRDVTVFYYSQGDVTGNKESVLEFVIDRDRTPRIVEVRSDFDTATQEGIVYWYGDDDVQRVHWQINSGPEYITSGQSNNTGWFPIAVGQKRNVTMTPYGRGHQGTTVVATLLNPARTPRVELKVVARREYSIDLEYEVEGYGDAAVHVHASKNFGPYSQVLGTPPQHTITRDSSEVYLNYFASGTTTGLLSDIFTFVIDYNHIAQITATAIEFNYNQNRYVVKWWTDDDADSVHYNVNSGTWYSVLGQHGQTTPQDIVAGQTDEVTLLPSGSAGAGRQVVVYPSLPPSASALLPPHIVISGANDGYDGGGSYVLVDVYSYNASGVSAGNIQYAERNAVWSDAGTHTYQHKVYRPYKGDTFGRYRAYIGDLYSDTIVFNIDSDDVPEIRPSIDLSADQAAVRIAWQGDDDVESVEIIPSGEASRVYNQQAGKDEETTIAYGETKNFTIQPFGAVAASGVAGKLWPLRITKPSADSPWMSISKQSENNATIPATVTLKFDAESAATGVYYSVSGTSVPGGIGWTSITNGATQAFDRPEGDASLVVRGYAAKGTLYSSVATFTIDPDEVPAVTSAYYTSDWANNRVLLSWNVDDDTDYVQLYLNGSSWGTPIIASTTTIYVNDILPGTAATITIVPKRGTAEFPQFGKTVSIYRADESGVPVAYTTPSQSGSTGTLDLVVRDEILTVTSIQKRTKQGSGEWSVWSNLTGGTGTIGTDKDLTRSATIALAESHNSEIGIRLAWTDIHAQIRYTYFNHVFDFDTIPDVVFYLYRIDSDVFLRWIGDEDTASIRYRVSESSMPTSNYLNTGTINNNREGEIYLSGEMFPGRILYVRARGYSATGGTGNKSTTDFQGTIKSFQDGVPGILVLPTQTGTEGQMTLTINDPNSLVTATSFEPRNSTTGFAVNVNPANWSGFDGTAPFGLTSNVTLTPKHNSIIHWGVRYKDYVAGTLTQHWVTGSHTYDLDLVAEVTSISIYYDSSGYPQVSVVGDEDCEALYITVGVNNTNPADPTDIAYDGRALSSRNATIATTVATSMGDEITIKARGYNVDDEAGPVVKETFLRGDTANLPFHIQVDPTQPSQGNGRLFVKIHDPSLSVQNIQWKKKSDYGDFDASWTGVASGTGWDTATGTCGVAATLERTEDISLVQKHQVSIKIMVTYKDSDGVTSYFVTSHTYDAGLVAEVAGTEVTFDTTTGKAIVNVIGDEDCKDHYITAQVGSSPADPTTSDKYIATRSGLVNTDVVVTYGEEIYIKVRPRDFNNQWGVLHQVRVIRATGEVTKTLRLSVSGSLSRGSSSTYDYLSAGIYVYPSGGEATAQAYYVVSLPHNITITAFKARVYRTGGDDEVWWQPYYADESGIGALGTGGYYTGTGWSTRSTSVSHTRSSNYTYLILFSLLADSALDFARVRVGWLEIDYTMHDVNETI